MHEHARAYAIAAHGDQKYGTRPYAFHLDAVARLAAPYGEQAITVAYLHDVVEDTATPLAEVEREFGPFIAACVDLLTDGPGASRKERKTRTYARLATVSGDATLALLVKVADRLANVRACIEDRKLELWRVYQGEHVVFRAAAYRAGQCDMLWTKLDALVSDGAFDAA